MKRHKIDKSLLNRERFAFLNKEKKAWLEKLSMKRALRLEESLLSSSLIWEWRKNFSEDKPLCLKYSLRKKK